MNHEKNSIHVQSENQISSDSESSGTSSCPEWKNKLKKLGELLESDARGKLAEALPHYTA